MMLMRTIGPGIRSVSIPGGPAFSEQIVLSLLYERGEVTPGELAAFMKVRPQSIVQTLDSLSRHGWILRSPGRTDRRQVLVSATPEGREIHERQFQARKEWVGRLLSGLTEGELDNLALALDAMEKAAGAMEGLPNAPRGGESAPAQG